MERWEPLESVGIQGVVVGIPEDENTRNEAYLSKMMPLPYLSTYHSRNCQKSLKIYIRTFSFIENNVGKVL